MQVVTTVGLDIAKSVFQVHGVDAAGQVVIRRQLKRRYVLAFFEKLPPCLVGIEACASSHHWSRELKVLGHTVKLMPPAYVKPYVKRQKNDATDAEAICEAVIRSTMRFVATSTPEQQSGLTLHRTRYLFIRHSAYPQERTFPAHRSHEASKRLDPAADDWRRSLRRTSSLRDRMSAIGLRDLLFLRVSQINGCSYCVDEHARDLRRRANDVSMASPDGGKVPIHRAREGRVRMG